MRVLVIEDSVRLRASLQRGLSREGFSVDTVGEGGEGLVLAANNPFDLVILDLGLPGMDGEEVLRELRARGCDVPVLILTARDETTDVVAGFELGADDFLVKPFAFEELVVRCRALLRRRYGRASTTIEIGDLAIDPARRTVCVDGQAIDVTARDLKVLEYLAARAGEVVTREELEDHVYRTTDLPSSNAIDVAIYTLRRKIDVDGEPSHIRTVRGVGYVLETAS